MHEASKLHLKHPTEQLAFRVEARFLSTSPSNWRSDLFPAHANLTMDRALDFRVCRLPAPTAGVLVLAGLVALGCQEENKQKQKPSQTPSPSQPQAPPEPPPEPPPPWFQRTWHAQPQLIPVIPPTQVDALERKGKPIDVALPNQSPRSLPLRVTISANRVAQGRLGELELRGVLDEETLRVRILGPNRRGVLLAERTSDGLSGEIRLSRGDSQKRWKATILLQPQAGQ